MNTYDKLVSFSSDDKFDVSAEEWREFLNELMAHFKSGKSPAGAANLMGVMAVSECQAHQDKAEAMQCGFRLAMHLARSDFPLVQKALRQERQKKSVASKSARSQERKENIIRDYLELLETCEHIEAVTKLAKKHGQTKRYIRDIVMPSKPK